MSDTPRTDALYNEYKACAPLGRAFEPVALCRTLERELAACQRENARLRAAERQARDDEARACAALCQGQYRVMVAINELYNSGVKHCSAAITRRIRERTKKVDAP